MARTTAAAVRQELDVTASEYPSIEDGNVSEEKILDAWIRRAHTLVEKRLPKTADGALLTDLETLAAAHFGFPRITGSTAGKDVKRVKGGSATVAYETTEVGPDGVSSPYWAQAVRLDSRIADEGSFFAHTL